MGIPDEDSDFLQPPTHTSTMGGDLDSLDRLEQACTQASSYPNPPTILKKCHPRHILNRYHEELRRNETILFEEDASRSQLLFWELWPGDERGELHRRHS